MIDTHAHIYSEDFKYDLEKILEEAQSEGIKKIFMPAIDASTHSSMLTISESYPEVCYPMIGLHPCSVSETLNEELLDIENLLQKHRFYGIGETGLDLHWDKTFAHLQVKSLEQHISWAIEYDLPLILHTRHATDETIEIIERFASSGLSGIFHCFGGSSEQAKRITDLGFYLGIGGVITFKNSGLADCLKTVDLKHIVMETDAPYLAPMPYRGKRNQPAYLKEIARKIAEIKKISFSDVVQITSENANSIFFK